MADSMESDNASDNADLKISAHTKDAFCVDCFRGKWLATGGEDDCALLFDLDIFDIEPILRITDHVDSVIYVRFNSSGMFLASGDMSGKIIITDTSHLMCIHEINECSELEWLDWHKEADVLFAGASNGIIWEFSVSQVEVSIVRVFAEGSGTSSNIGKILGCGLKLLCAFSNGTVRIWSLLDPKSTAISVDMACTCVDAHKSLPLAAIGGQDGKCIIINTEKDKVMRLLNTAEACKTEKVNEQIFDETVSYSVECIQFSCFKDIWIAVGTNNGFLIIYDINRGCIRHICDHGGYTVVKCHWFGTSDGIQVIITACLDGIIRIWDVFSGNKVFELLGGGEGILDMALCLDTHRIFTVSSGGTLRVLGFPSYES